MLFRAIIFIKPRFIVLAMVILITHDTYLLRFT
nr:MAG TPA: AAA domain protein [Caudoviricetes sp.]